MSCVTTIVIIQLLAHEMFRPVVLADVLNKFLLWSKVKFHVHVERFHKGSWVLEGYRRFHVAEIHAPVALGHAQHFSVGQRASTEPA